MQVQVRTQPGSARVRVRAGWVQKDDGQNDKCRYAGEYIDMYGKEGGSSEYV